MHKNHLELAGGDSLRCRLLVCLLWKSSQIICHGKNGAALCLHNVDQRKCSVECGKIKSGSIFHFMPCMSNTYYCTQTTTQCKCQRQNYYSVKASSQAYYCFSVAAWIHRILVHNTLFIQFIFGFCYINKPHWLSSSLHQSLCCSTRQRALVRNSTTLQANTQAQIKHWLSWFQGYCQGCQSAPVEVK